MRHLRYFLAVAEEGSFRGAARKLFLSQPTLSHQIQQLEMQMGTTLIERLPRRARLTPAGRILHTRAIRILRELDDARREISELQQLSSGEVRIGIVSTVNVAVIPEAVGNFRNAHPNITVIVCELPMEALEAELLSGNIDFGISFIPGKSGRRIENEPLFTERLVVVLPTMHALARRRRITLSDALDHPLVLLSHGFCTRELVLDSVALQNLEHILKPAIEMNSIDGVLATVRRTGMLTLMPDAAVCWERHPDLVVKPLCDDTEKLSYRSVGIVWAAGGHRSAAASAFVDQIKAVLAER